MLLISISISHAIIGAYLSSISPDVVLYDRNLRIDRNTPGEKCLSAVLCDSSLSNLYLADNTIMEPQRRVIIEELCTAFLGISAFNASYVWINNPVDDTKIFIHITKMTATQISAVLKCFN